MNDSFGRIIRYLRISITDRCNLRCFYCTPTQEFKLLRHKDILSFEEIAHVAETAVGMGFNKMRLTGGEPLIRRHVDRLVRMLAAIKGIEDLAMTTNATLLDKWAETLAEAGLMRINVSLDTIRPDRYAEITGGGDIRRALAGIDAALKAGLTPVKLNCVVEESSEEPDAREVAAFAREKGCEIRFIPRMELATGIFSVVQGGMGGDCPRCDRIRLSSNGYLWPCLFSDLGFSVRELGAEEALRQAIIEKPKAGTARLHNWMRAIGG